MKSISSSRELLFRTNECSGMQYRAFWNDDDSVPYRPTAFVYICAFGEGFYGNAFTNAGVLVDDGPLDVATWAYAHRNITRIWPFVRIVIVSAHDDCFCDLDIIGDPAT